MRIFIIVQAIILLLPTIGRCYLPPVHVKIAAQAISDPGFTGYLNSMLSLDTGALLDGKPANEWITFGSKEEDNDIRGFAHFYDYKNHYGIWNIMDSSLVWGENGNNNDFSWNKARSYFYNALISTNAYDREYRLAKTFRSVGQVMHLVQDLSVPSHVRNDAHPDIIPYYDAPRDMYEKYTLKEVERNEESRLVYIGYSPVSISDFNALSKYWTDGGKGLSEFTGRNFLSRDTNFGDSRFNQYAEPVPIDSIRINETLDNGKTVAIEYYSGIATDTYRPESITVQRLTALSYLSDEAAQLDNSKRVYSLNDNIHQEYASILIPRALGYSAGVLNYFFRGKLAIAPPASGVYAKVLASGELNTITLRLANDSAGEVMSAGDVTLVVSYSRDTSPSGIVSGMPAASYIASQPQAVASLPNRADNSWVELTFTLPQAIPFDATDIAAQVVFKGKLGNEDGAVAVGRFDISEPTPVEVVNSTDRACIGGQWYQSGSPEAIAAVKAIDNQTDTRDVFPHKLQDIYVKISPADAGTIASPTNYDFHVPILNEGKLIRIGYLLTDTGFNYSFNETWVNADPADPFPPELDTPLIYVGTPLKNQTVFIQDADNCAPDATCHYKTAPAYYSFRGIDMWWGASLIYYNKPFPADAVCPE